VRAPRLRHLGLVACSPEGAALCYRSICEEAQAALGPNRYPEMSMHGHPLAEYVERLEADDWSGVAELMLSSARKLAAAGAELLISPDNTIHRVFTEVAAASPLPWLSIVDEVAAEAGRRGFRRVGITGTAYTMESRLYPEVLEQHGIASSVPAEADRAWIHRTILEELVRGVFASETTRRFADVIARFAAEGCDAVVLGCTEIPFVVSDESSPLPVLDSTRILARAAVQKAGEGSR
jgi:aspartate racemase